MTDVEPAPPSFWRAVRLTFETTARNARTCLTLVSIYAVLSGVTNAIGGRLSLEDIDPTRASPGELVAILAAGVAGFGTFVLVTIFILPPTIGALSLVGSAAVAGDELETGGIVRRVFDRALEVIGAFVLTLLILLIAPIVIGLVALLVGVSVGAEAAFGALLFVSFVLVVPSLYVFVRLSLAVPVVLREGLGPVNALRRSWELVGGTWWWFFGVIIVVWVGAGVLGGALAAAFSLGNAGLFTAARAHETSFALAVLGNTVGAAITGSISGVLAGVLYEARAETRPPAELPLHDAAGLGTVSREPEESNPDPR